MEQKENIKTLVKSKGRVFSETIQATIITGLIAIITVSITSYFNLATIKQEQKTTLEAQIIERETQLILNVFGIKDKNEAAKSLIFFVEAGYLRDPKGKIKELAKDPSNIPFFSTEVITLSSSGSTSVDISDFSTDLLNLPKISDGLNLMIDTIPQKWYYLPFPETAKNILPFCKSHPQRLIVKINDVTTHLMEQ